MVKENDYPSSAVFMLSHTSFFQQIEAHAVTNIRHFERQNVLCRKRPARRAATNRRRLWQTMTGTTGNRPATHVESCPHLELAKLYEMIMTADGAGKQDQRNVGNVSGRQMGLDR
jgi:hypothetical protein